MLMDGDDAVLALQLPEGTLVRAENEIGEGEWVFD